jgi:hypothetical protein
VTPASSNQENHYLSPHHSTRTLVPPTLRSAPPISSTDYTSNDVSPARDQVNHRQSYTPSQGYAASIRSSHSIPPNQGNSRTNSPHTSTRNQLPPSNSNIWLPKSPSQMSQSLAPDQPVTSRAPSRAGAATPRMSSADVRMTPGSIRNHPLPSTNGNGDLGLSHALSNASLRAAGSYTRFEPSTYLDPAYFPPEGLSAAANGSMSNVAGATTPRSRTHSISKAVSSTSSLEYVG